jgi:hypothetical protein
MLRPIGFQSLDEAMPVLSRGFSRLPLSSWTESLNRLRQYGATRVEPRTGYLLQDNSRDVGVILTIPSARDTADGVSPVVNLSSWYIDPEHRWRAPRMLQRIVSCDATLFTDLTPTQPVRTMIGRFGFRGWTEGALVFALPWFAIQATGESHIVPLHRLPPDAFTSPIRRMMDEHAALDCVAGALWDGRALHPLIFSRTRRRGLPVARLVYAENRATVIAHMPAIARFLLREKVLLLAVNANQSERVCGSIFTQRPSPAYFKGDRTPPQCDLAYSEYVFLQV